MTLPVLVAWSILTVAIQAFLIWAIIRWWRTSPRIEMPAWRSYLGIGAIALGGVSDLLLAVSAVWAAIHGGEPYNPVFQWIGSLGFLAAPASLLAGLFGKGALRWPACGLSIFMMFSWLIFGLSVSDL